MSTAAIYAGREGCIVDGRFALQRWLGGSAESGVYLTEVGGEQPRRAAIKLVAADAPGAEIRLAGWTAAARIDHPHLLRVLHTGRSALDGGVDGGQVVYAVTEFAEEVLAEILPERALTPDETREMLEPILDALGSLHSHGFVHGRLKPTNILVVGDRIKLSADCSPIASGKAAAVPPIHGAFDAPEIGRGVLSPAADMWSLGMTIAAALTQRTPPWDRESGFEPVVRPALPAPFESIVRDCLRIDPASRLTLPELKESLEGNAPAKAVPAGSHADFDPDFDTTPARSNRWAAVSIAAAIILGIAVTALVLHSRQSPPAAPVAAPTSTSEQEPSSPADQQPAASSSAPAAASSSAMGKKPSAAAPGHPVRPAPPVAASEPPADHSGVQGDAGNGGNGAVLKRVLPDVLPEARSTIRGKVHIRVRVTVDAGGNVSDAVSESPGASRYFNRIAMEAARAWKFAPPRDGGNAAPSAWDLQFEFRQDGTDVTAAEQSR